MTQLSNRATENPHGRLLSLDDSLGLDIKTSNEFFARHLNRHMLQIFDVLGLGDMDIVAAEGMEIVLRDGRRLLDFSTGLGAASLGHNHPRILAAEKKCHDLKVIDCIKLAPHKLQGALAYNIAQCLPAPLSVSFFSVSGAEANEAAMKLAERVQMPKGKTKFLSMRGAFHGKTHGTLSLTTAADAQRGFLLGVPKANMIYAPYGNIRAIKDAIARETDATGVNSIMAVFVESIRGAACEVPPPGYLTELADLCRKHDILVVFDEVTVGAGRTGRFCAFMEEDVVPDIVTLAKTIGGGKRELGVMVTSQKLFDIAYGNRKDSALHTSTFSGLGETCAVAIETLNVLADERLIERAAAMGDHLAKGLEGLRAKHPKTVLEVRGRGLFQAIRLNFNQDLAAKLVDISSNPLFQTYQSVLIGSLSRELYDRHDILVHVQPGARDLLHFMPPFTVTEQQLDRLIDALDAIFARGLAEPVVRFVAKNLQRVFDKG